MSNSAIHSEAIDLQEAILKARRLRSLACHDLLRRFATRLRGSAQTTEPVNA